MIELGNSLRAAREAKGYSVRQLSEMTRMAPSTIQDLEAENFSHIAAPIYGRGFVKLYCETVGLDPKPYVNEFMEIFNGNRLTEIRERQVQNEPDDAIAPAADKPAIEPPAPERRPLTPPPTVQEPDLFQQASAIAAAAAASESSLSRYAAPIRHERPFFDLQAALRIGVLAVGALVLLGLLLWGLSSVYRATTRSDEPSVSAAPAADKRPAAKTNAGRTPQKIPSLYID